MKAKITAPNRTVTASPPYGRSDTAGMLCEMVSILLGKCVYDIDLK